MGWGEGRKVLILRVHWKIQGDFSGGFTKKQYIGGNCHKNGGRPWTVCRFKRGLGKKRRGIVFLRGHDTPMLTIDKLGGGGF